MIYWIFSVFFSLTALAADKVDTDINPADKVQFSTSGGRTDAQGKVTLGLRLITHDNFTLYTDKVSFKGPEGFILGWLKGPQTRRLLDPISGKEVDVYEAGDFEMEMAGFEAWTKPEFPIAITFVACTQTICLFPFTQVVMVPVYPKGPDPIPTALVAAATATAGQDQIGPAPEGLDELQRSWAARFKKGDLPLGLMLGLLFLAGMLTNLTPCVFPMIPITMRVLANQGMRPLLSATLYAAGIVVSYSVLGLAVGLSGGIFGALSASTGFNVTFAIVMAVLGFTMLGFGNLAKLQNMGARIGSGKASPLNTFLMGIGAGLVASPCTGPILAALLASAATAGNAPRAAGLLFVYSVGFALPYVLLGSVAANLTKIKVRPTIQVGIKAAFAAVMFALALYYLRIPFYSVVKELHGSWQFIASSAIGAGVTLCTLILLNPRFVNNKVALILPTFVLGVGLFGASQWATGGDALAIVKLTWNHDEATGLAAAKQSGKPILIDGWAEWCEACKKMDATTFLDPDLAIMLNNDWILVKLDLTDMNEQNEVLAQKYGLQGLPTMVLLPKDGDITKIQRIVGYVSAPTLMKGLEEFKRGMAP